MEETAIVVQDQSEQATLPIAIPETSEKLMREKANGSAGVPSEPGFYWATRIAWPNERAVVNVATWPTGILVVGTFADRYPEMPKMLADFTDWSPRLIDPGVQKEGG